MAARFFVPNATAPGDLVVLPSDEAEHLRRVLRLAVGDPVRVFNGRGGEFDSVVESSSRGDVRVRIGKAREPAREPRLPVTLAQAVLKGDRMDDVVRDAVMIGVAAIQPIATVRTELSLASMARGHKRERWQRIAVSASKQSGRAIVPEVRDPVLFGMFVDDVSRLSSDALALMLVEPQADGHAVTFSELPLDPPREVVAAIGPEGGWAAEELEKAASSLRQVTLGGRTLRADAMAIVLVAALFSRWGEFDQC